MFYVRAVVIKYLYLYLGNDDYDFLLNIEIKQLKIK